MKTEKAKSSHFDRTRGFKNQIFPTPVYYIEYCRIFTVLIYIPCALLHTIGSRFAKPLIFESIRAKLISTNWWWVDNAIAEDQATTANVLEVSLTQQLNIIYVYVHFSAKHIRTLIMFVRMFSFQQIRGSKCKNKEGIC